MHCNPRKLHTSKSSLLLLLLDHLQKRVTHKRPDPIKSSLPGKDCFHVLPRICTKLPSIHWFSPSPKQSALPWLEAFGPWKNSMKHFDRFALKQQGIASKFRMPRLGMGRYFSGLSKSPLLGLTSSYISYICLPSPKPKAPLFHCEPKQASLRARNVILAAATLIFVQLRRSKNGGSTISIALSRTCSV